MLDKVPLEVRIEILSRLPVQTLLRFRCVSRSWCALIDSSYFIKTQLKTSIATNSNLSLLFGGNHPNFLRSLSLDSTDSVFQLDYPLNNYHHVNEYFKIFGSCDGLLCFSNVFKGRIRRICLMNPSTRQHHLLPFTPLDKLGEGKRGLHTEFLGFGHDPVLDDYKVVRLSQFSGYSEPSNSFETETVIYNLKSNSWKKIAGMPYYLDLNPRAGVLLVNALHWMAFRVESNSSPIATECLVSADLIVAFDLINEEYREVVATDDARFGLIYFMSLGVVREWLSLTIVYEDRQIVVWVMKEYGVCDSWARIASFMPNIIQLQFFRFLTTLVFSKSGDEILIGSEVGLLLWYNLKEKIVKKVGITNSVVPYEAEVFRASLVRLNHNKQSDGHESRSIQGEHKDR